METVKKGGRKIKVRWILLALTGVLALGAAFAVLADAPSRGELQALEIGAVDFDGLRDGTYTGQYVGTKGSLRDVTLEVTISGGEVADIRVSQGALDPNGEPANLTGGLTVDDLFRKAIQNKTLEVDAVSGATLTSKAHLKALEDALLKAQKASGGLS